MPIPDFIVALRTKLGHDLLWLSGVTAVVLRDDQVLLVRRSDNGAWSPVTGIVDPGEHPAVTAQREVLEETGVACEVLTLAGMHVTDPVVHTNGDHAQYLDHTFACRYLDGDAHPADDESSEVGWFHLDALPPMPEHLLRRILLVAESAGYPAPQQRRPRGDHQARHRFTQVDVFGAEAFVGNPVAVVHDADDLDAATMQRIARWTNLSETTFLLRPTLPQAHYRMRVFTPDAELPFAGHPTLGTARAWLEALPASTRAALPPVLLQECGVGLVEVRRGEEHLAFAAPPLLHSGPLDDATLDRVVAALRIAPEQVRDAAWVDNGPGWLAVFLPSAADVLALRPGPMDGLFVGAVGPTPAGSPEAVEVRAFFPVGDTTVEDPVTGSLNASLAQWLTGAGHLRLPYTARQGSVLGRAGQVHLDGDPTDPSRIWVGGRQHVAVRGELAL
jgi:PhzF family phenazine biosynthesis protein